jgi:hypothetical protein
MAHNIQRFDPIRFLILKTNQPITPPMPNKGFRGFRAFSLASSFGSVDNDALRNPLLGIAVTVVPNCDSS